MSAAVVELAAIQNGNGPAAHKTNNTTLENLLDLPAAGLGLASVRVCVGGSTSQSSADLTLNDQGGPLDGSIITIENLADVCNPTRLTALIVVGTRGRARPQIKAPAAMQALALMCQLGAYEQTTTRDHLAVEWGITFLQGAIVLDVDLNDQGARWGAFRALEYDVGHRAIEASATIAGASTVLRHADGSRLVRCGWFRDHVKRDDAAISPQEIAHRMQRVGWQRRGKSGRIKATRPGLQGALGWTFYVVPKGWEDDR